ncbi:MAG: DUF4351 domain-containing protein [Oscillatoriales cyanobacterium SM2_1_8]|nr:DUF4351 domain-containing protein [Oscillatoriales cyanobacterium SM2_1_8]
MFALGDLRETRVYQEGRQAEGTELVLRLLHRRLGAIAPQQQQQILALPLAQLEELAEALLDWHSPAELTRWLAEHPTVANSV